MGRMGHIAILLPYDPQIPMNIRLDQVDDLNHARIELRTDRLWKQRYPFICTLINWEAHGITICGEARDGAEALELLKSVKADILMTDIRMPVMDGLELMERVSLQYPQIRSIIMS